MSNSTLTPLSPEAAKLSTKISQAKTQNDYQNFLDQLSRPDNPRSVLVSHTAVAERVLDTIASKAALVEALQKDYTSWKNENENQPNGLDKKLALYWTLTHGGLEVSKEHQSGAQEYIANNAGSPKAQQLQRELATLTPNPVLTALKDNIEKDFGGLGAKHQAQNKAVIGLIRKIQADFPAYQAYTKTLYTKYGQEYDTVLQTLIKTAQNGELKIDPNSPIDNFDFSFTLPAGVLGKFSTPAHTQCSLTLKDETLSLKEVEPTLETQPLSVAGTPTSLSAKGQFKNVADKIKNHRNTHSEPAPTISAPKPR